MITLGDLQSFERSSSFEWLETNGLGGYASGTVSGANTRRYHGMLVPAMNPPVGRMVVVSKWEESILINGQQFDLSSNQYPGTIYPQGFQHLTRFERGLFPVFYYEADGVVVKKTIAMVHNRATTLVLYEVVKTPSPFTMEFLPLYSCKDFHAEAHANDHIHHHYLFQDDVFRTFNYQDCPEFFIKVPGSTFKESKNWYYRFEHALEKERGLDFQEDLFSHGRFSVELKSGAAFGVILSLDDPTGLDAMKLFEEEKKRREKLISKSDAANIQQLMLAADQFIVKRGEGFSIIAGYPWFADWGRDAMISLPGLCLTTGRYEEARQILLEFSKHVSDGMLPNRFPDYGERPEYNTIDATLWYFVSVYRYYQATQDSATIQTLLPVLEDIIHWHYKGTRFHIKVDKHDELLRGGLEGVQLTWMDAKVGDWVVTPRIGKPVEINALWYNALRITEFLLEETNQKRKAATERKRAEKVASHFMETFWYAKGGYLYDYVGDQGPDLAIRPNQIFAISLPFPLVDQAHARKILKVVEKELLTPKGLRSLSPRHPDYQPFYLGPGWQRDGAYHQGTVWSFLVGPYIDALMYAHGEAGRKSAAKLISQLIPHLEEGCIGSVSEIFDGEKPHPPRGACAQAWSVAEVLRVCKAYQLL